MTFVLSHPSELTYREIAWLHASDRVHIPQAQMDIRELVQDIWTGETDFWKCPDGIVLAQKLNLRYNIFRIGGRGIILHLDELVQDLQHRAIELGCTGIDCMVYNEKLIKALQRKGWKPEAVNLVVEF